MRSRHTPQLGFRHHADLPYLPCDGTGCDRIRFSLKKTQNIIHIVQLRLEWISKLQNHFSFSLMNDQPASNCHTMRHNVRELCRHRFEMGFLEKHANPIFPARIRSCYNIFEQCLKALDQSISHRMGAVSRRIVPLSVFYQ